MPTLVPTYGGSIGDLNVFLYAFMYLNFYMMSMSITAIIKKCFLNIFLYCSYRIISVSHNLGNVCLTTRFHLLLEHRVTENLIENCFPLIWREKAVKYLWCFPKDWTLLFLILTMLLRVLFRKFYSSRTLVVEFLTHVSWHVNGHWVYWERNSFLSPSSEPQGQNRTFTK